MLKNFAKNGSTEWRKQLKQQFNKDSVTVAISGPYLCKAGENVFIDSYAFKLSGVSGKVQKQPKSYLDVKAQVTSDYQLSKEKQWVEELRKKFAYSIDEAVLKTIQ